MLNKQIVKDFLPPILLRNILKIREKNFSKKIYKHNSGVQNLDIYWDAEMAAALETWGEGSAWDEIEMLMTGLHGKALDIACGTGKVMCILENLQNLEIHGCDISDFLLMKAEEKGVSKNRLVCCDAQKMNYSRHEFDYAYTIGSLEHFTEEGITSLLKEANRVAKKMSFHMIPVSKSNLDEGWIQPYQSYYNNSIDWWLNLAKPIFPRVTYLNSKWNDPRSLGIWLICDHQP